MLDRSAHSSTDAVDFVGIFPQSEGGLDGGVEGEQVFERHGELAAREEGEEDNEAGRNFRKPKNERRGGSGSEEEIWGGGIEGVTTDDGNFANSIVKREEFEE